MPRFLRVGVDAAAPEPLQIGSPSSADFRGFEVDLVDIIGKELRYGIAFEAAEWGALLRNLASGTIDCICSAATLTAERRRIFDASEPYLDVDLALVATSAETIGGASCLYGRRVAVRNATTAHEFLSKRVPSARVATFESNAEIYDALQCGAFDAAVDDRPIALALSRQRTGVHVGPPLPQTRSQYGMLFRRGEPLKQSIDRVLDAIARDGTLNALEARWFAAEQVR
jgi:polar amino acid transport system substrate-binding protein